MAGLTDSRAARMAAMVGRAEGDTRLRRSLGPVSLGAIGVATIVGAGIFVLAGDAAGEYAGPAVAVSFVLAGLAAGLSALCYAEMASMLPVAGSTYTYTYAALGRFWGWVIGWDLMLEYLLGGAAVAAGWAGYVDNVIPGLPHDLLNGPFDGGVINLPALVIVALVTGLLVLGMRESARATNALVALKVAALVLFVAVGAFHVTRANLTPFVPENTGGFGHFGWSGVVRAAGLVFFAYIGFDAVCTAAQEARRPRRTVPAGVLGSLALATALYIAVAIVMTGMVPYQQLISPDALSIALGAVPQLSWLRSLMDVSAVVALAATVLAVIYAQSRILLRMGEDRLLPPSFNVVDPRTGTPIMPTLACGASCAMLAALVPLETLGNLVSIGTLLAFVLVSTTVIVLRRTEPDLPRGFRVPGGPLVPALAIVVDLALAAMIPVSSWIRLVAWFLIGLVVYLSYGRRQADPTAPEPIRP